MIKYNTASAFICSIVLALFLRILAPMSIEIIIPYCSFFGQVFLQSLMMVVAPLVLVSIFLGALRITLRPDATTFAPKMLGVFFFNSFFSALIGAISFVIYLPFLISQESSFAVTSPSNPIFTLFLRLFPKNIFKALADLDMIGLIVFFSFLGICTALTLKKEFFDLQDRVIQGAEFLSTVLFKMVRVLILALPLGVFFIVLETFLKFNVDSMKKITLFLSMFGTGVVIYITAALAVITIVLKQNPFSFLKKSMEPLLLAFSSSSSAVTLPVAIDTLDKKFGIEPSLIRFVMPMGITMNMAGTTLFVTIASLYILSLCTACFDFSLSIAAVILSWMVCLGTAGVPSGCLVALMVVLSSLGVSTDEVALLVGIDRFLDMIRTTLNIFGNLIATQAIYQFSKK